MRVHPNAACCRPSLGVNILVTVGGIGPRPAGAYHQCLKVVLASEADRDRPIILVVIVHLVTRHGTAGDASDESLGRANISSRILADTRTS